MDIWVLSYPADITFTRRLSARVKCFPVAGQEWSSLHHHAGTHCGPPNAVNCCGAGWHTVKGQVATAVQVGKSHGRETAQPTVE